MAQNIDSMIDSYEQLINPNNFECIVKMWNQFNDEWVTGIGIYDVPTGKWEVRDSGLGIYSVHFWFAVPNL